MKIAVLSGKGGTGKTFVSANLAAVIPKSTYVDCDVEAPNGHLFFKPKIETCQEVCVKVPRFNMERCIGCKACVSFCAYHALAFVKNKPFLFPEVCHACGGCQMICPSEAVSEVDKEVGKITMGTSGDVTFLGGQMKLGEASGVPVIKALLKQLKEEKETVIDCPPGSGCMVMTSIMEADYCILVAEPTIFGKDNLKMVYELTRLYNKPVGVFLNKTLNGENPSEDLCKELGIGILGKLPFEKEIGAYQARGELAVFYREDIKACFHSVLENIREQVKP